MEREEEAVASPPAAAQPPPAAAAPGEISFRNAIAVRTGLLAAALASLLIALPMPVYLALVWLLVCLLSAGFFAVFLYSRRTGETLPLRAGLRIGWITGIFCFAIAFIFFTISIIGISAREGGLAAFYQEQLGERASDAAVQQFLEVLQNPAGLAVMLLVTAFFLFLMFTVLPLIGAALGAKVLEKD